MRQSEIRAVLLVLIIAALPGCRLMITVPTGGHVTGGSPAHFCDSGQSCNIEFANTGVSANFQAVPWDGWIFMGWRKDWKYLCGGSQESCDLSTDNPYLLSTYPFITELIESDELFFLQPVFVRGTPIDTAIAAVSDPDLRACLQFVVDDIGDVQYAEELHRLECGNMSSLQGLDAFVGLEQLKLEDFENESIDLSPLRALVRLHTLAIVGNGDDDTFEDTHHLAEQLISLPLLESLDLSRNNIHNLAPLAAPLAQLKRLTGLNLWGNYISELSPLADLSQLTSLNLLGNQIEDIRPLATLTQLRFLELTGNTVSDLSPLATLTELRTLNTIGSPLTDISPLQELEQLQFLNLSGGSISNLAPLASLEQIEVLRVRNNEITDTDALAGLDRLYLLDLAGNSIDDIGGLAGLSRMDFLDLSRNAISDLGPLVGMTALQELHLSQNEIVDIGPLATLVNLLEIHLDSNAITDISPLSDLEHLEFLFLMDNEISEIQGLIDSLSPETRVLLMENPLSCEDIHRLLNIDTIDVVYEPLPPGCT